MPTLQGTLTILKWLKMTSAQFFAGIAVRSFSIFISMHMCDGYSQNVTKEDCRCTPWNAPCIPILEANRRAYQSILVGGGST